ncbi:MAG: hypothetical protein JWN78_1784 [Bacteroidota bacterium]|nr:hypothetical protein [Bacteroidota bacterium]
MEFSTKVDIPSPAFRITHADKMLMMGSCFTENIGAYLLQNKFKININPFGIIYNPVSLFYNLKRVIDRQFYTEGELLYRNELYLSLDHHGRFSGHDKQQVLENINKEIEAAYNHFKDSHFIFITPGTSFVYRHMEQDRIVANCHKIPNTAFEKRLLRIEEIVSAFDKIQPQLKDKKVLFTVSPVRHWRDGAIENQRSKSILIESIHQIISKYSNCFYFPAYEIVMDELRDYRFYGEDMLHPNATAIKYIWERFSETYFSGETININKEIEKINLLLQHRIKNENTREEKAFQEHIKKTIDVFRKDHPEIDVASTSSSFSRIGNSM